MLTNLESISLAQNEEDVTEDEMSKYRHVVIRTELDHSNQSQTVEEEGKHGQRDQARDKKPVQYLDKLQVVHRYTEHGVGGLNSNSAPVKTLVVTLHLQCGHQVNSNCHFVA